MAIFSVSATFLIALLAGCFIVKHIEAIGNATGFAAGVTGGGDLPPQIPADIDELVRWLADDTPRVILLDRTFDYSDTEGAVTEMGCRPPSNTCPCIGGQDSNPARPRGRSRWCDPRADCAACGGARCSRSRHSSHGP